jgi:hypothetical protein
MEVSAEAWHTSVERFRPPTPYHSRSTLAASRHDGEPMDRVTKTYLDAFAEEQQLTLSDPVMFEHFVDYCVVSDLFDDEFNVAEIHTGGGNDLGIDGIAIIANGVLVTSPEEVTDLVDLNGSLDVTFVFIQAKSGNSFSADEISAFCDGVDDFFAEDPKLPMNDDVVAARVVMQRIYDNSIKFRRFKPLCRLSFATTGQWQADHYIQTKINKRIEELEATGLFSKVVFTPMGADELHSSYQRSKNSVTTEFEFSDKVLLPEIAGVEVAYLGYVPAAEFMKLISDGSGNIRKSLFTDNVRDFQDYNEVNTAIQGTLRDESLKGRFVVLNNGVTLVARELKTVRNKITITEVIPTTQSGHLAQA